MLGLTLLWATAGSGDPHLPQVPALRLWGVEGPGLVERLEPAGMQVGGEPIARVTYSFRHQGREFRRTMYDFGAHWSVGQEATVLYLPSDPATSRLRGEARAHSGLFGSFLYFLPLAAVVFGFPSWRRGLQDALLLLEGLPAEAQVLDVQPVRRWRGAEAVRCNYEFESLWGEVFRGSAIVPAVTAPSPKAVGEGGARRHALYLPRDASVSALMDALPLRYGLSVDGHGDWVAGWRVLPVLRFLAAAGLSLAGLAGLALQAGGLLVDIGR